MTAAGTLRRRAVTPASMELAAGWYIGLRSDTLRARPRPLELFGRELVAWRDGTGRAVVLSRYCAHLGASLALGRVVDGCLRCPFHHWRYDAAGTCVEIPGAAGISRTAHVRAYPVAERHGYIWVWYGGAEPAYPLPEVPALDASRGRYFTYRFAHTTPAPARRVLENAFDSYHFMTLHNVKPSEPVALTMLTDQRDAAENGPHIAGGAWIGAVLESRGLHLPRPLRALGITADRFSLLVDGWPGGQRLAFYLDGKLMARELLGVTPVAPGHTVMQGWTLVPRSSRPVRDVLLLLGYRAQHWQGTREDLAIYRDAADGERAVPVRYDHGVLRFRKWWADWVERARTAETDGA